MWREICNLISECMENMTAIFTIKARNFTVILEDDDQYGGVKILMKGEREHP